MTKIKVLGVVVALLAMVSCEVPVDQAKKGDGVSPVYVQDARTGKCIEIKVTAMADKSWASMVVADDSLCRLQLAVVR